MHEDETDDIATGFALAVLNGYMPLVLPTSPAATLVICAPETEQSMRAVYSPHFSDRVKVMIACAMYVYEDN